jgi:hypothetical protein
VNRSPIGADPRDLPRWTSEVVEVVGLEHSVCLSGVGLIDNSGVHELPK